METTEKIVEAYVRYVRGWATIPNIKCDGQFEIDLLAINPLNGDRYHIESSVSYSSAFSKLTANPFDRLLLKEPVQKPKMRRTLGYFTEHKFDTPAILEHLAQFGFKPGGYKKVIVTWDWTDDAKVQADTAGIELWDFRKMMKQIADALQDKRSYFTDDTLRTIGLYERARKDNEPES
jgi:hypothetical protein